MGSRGTFALIIIAVVVGVAVWLFASKPEPIPLEPNAVPPHVALPKLERSAAAQTSPPPTLVLPPQTPPGSMTTAPDPPSIPLPPVAPQPLGLPPGMGFPVANRDADGGIRFPLNKVGITTAMRQGLPEMRECYEEWLKAKPDLAGTLKVSFRIAADGGAEGVVDQVHLLADAGMGNVAFEGCVLSVVSDLRFDAPADGVMNVTYPLTFSSDGGS